VNFGCRHVIFPPLLMALSSLPPTMIPLFKRLGVTYASPPKSTGVGGSRRRTCEATQIIFNPTIPCFLPGCPSTAQIFAAHPVTEICPHQRSAIDYTGKKRPDVAPPLLRSDRGPSIHIGPTSVGTFPLLTTLLLQRERKPSPEHDLRHQ
jgi:hypothetical protein